MDRRCSGRDMLWVGCAVLGRIFFWKELLFWESRVGMYSVIDLPCMDRGIYWEGSAMVGCTLLVGIFFLAVEARRDILG